MWVLLGRIRLWPGGLSQSRISRELLVGSAKMRFGNISHDLASKCRLAHAAALSAFLERV